MKKTVLMLGIFWCLSLLVPASPLFASEEGVGKVVAARGEVSAIAPDGATRALSIRSPVHLQDTIRTGPRGRVQILFSDNTIFSLGRNSEMKVSEYEWDPAQKTGAMKTEVKEGAFRVLGGAITKSSPEKFTTETPVATIGIRGSMYAGSIRNGVLAVVFQGGTGIYVTNSSGTVDIRNPGFGTRVRGRGEAPEPPGRFESQDMDEVLGELEASAEEDGAAEESEPVQNTDEDRSTEDQDQKTGDGGDSVDDSAGQEGSAGGESTEEIAVEDQVEPLEDPNLSGMIDGNDVFDDPPADADPLIYEDPILGPTAVDPIVTETVTNSTQADLYQQVEPTIDPSPPTMTGKYTAMLYDPAHSSGATYNTSWLGDILGVSENGRFSGEAVALDGTTIPLDLIVPVYNPQGAYAGPVSLDAFTRTVGLLGSDRTFTLTGGASSDLGEFVLFGTDDSFTDETGYTYAFQELGFMGTPSTSLPTDGIGFYKGQLAGSSLSSTGSGIEAISAFFKIGANWHNGKVMGVIFGEPADPAGDKEGSPVYFFGEISGTSLVNVRIIGGGGEYDPYPETSSSTTTGSIYGPTFITGEGTFGQFYGSKVQGFGMTGAGESYAIVDQSAPLDTWQVTGGAFRDVYGAASPTASQGQHRWEGFVIGVGEDMSNPDTDRRIFLNSVSGDFSLLVDGDTGTVTGTLSATDLNDRSRTLSGITVGEGGSAYVFDDALIALITDDGTGVRNGAASGGLKTYGNYLVTEDPARQWGDYLSWGYWETAYVDPRTGQDIHVHMPASFWVAGERTDAAEVQGLIEKNFTGRYLGQAEGVYIDSYGVMQKMRDGTADLTIQFGAGIADPVTGTFNFEKPTVYDPFTGTTYVQQTIAVGGGGSVVSGGFHSGIVDGTGEVNGAFYGPGAAAVGGNFSADLGGEKYLGIFGAHLSAPQ